MNEAPAVTKAYDDMTKEEREEHDSKAREIEKTEQAGMCVLPLRLSSILPHPNVFPCSAILTVHLHVLMIV